MAELQFPIGVAGAPLARMIAAVKVDGEYRRFYGIQRPAPTAATVATETYEYSEGVETFAGARTPGNVSLTFAYFKGSMVDRHLTTQLANNANVELRFTTFGKKLYEPTDDVATNARLIAGATSTSANATKGLSELTAANASGSQYTAAMFQAAIKGGLVKEGAVIEYDTVPATSSIAYPMHLATIEALLPATGNDPDFKVYIRGIGSTAMTNGTAGNGTIVIRSPTTQWDITGEILSYEPNFDAAVRTATIEVVRSTEETRLVRLDDAYDDYTQ